MQNLDLPKIDDIDVLPAAEYNSFANELQNIMLAAGISLSGADLFQIARSIGTYVAQGDFYSSAGASNAYVLTSLGALRVPTAYIDKQRVIFKAPFSNTLAATVNANGIGVVAIVTAAQTPLVNGDIVANEYLTLRFSQSNNNFEISRGDGASNARISAFLTVNTVTGGGAVLVADRINQIEDSLTYVLPDASLVPSGQYVIVEIEKLFKDVTPIINPAALQTINGESSSPVLQVVGGVSLFLRFKSNGIDGWTF